MAKNISSTPVIALLKQWMADNGGAKAESIANLVGIDPSMIRAILRGDRKTLKCDTVDRILISLGMQGEWHASLLPYWLDDKQARAIEALDEEERSEREMQQLLAASAN